MNESLKQAREWAQNQQRGVAQLANYSQTPLNRGGTTQAQALGGLPQQLIVSLTDAIRKHSQVAEKGIHLNIVVHQDGRVSISDPACVDRFG